MTSKRRKQADQIKATFKANGFITLLPLTVPEEVGDHIMGIAGQYRDDVFRMRREALGQDQDDN